MKKLISLALVMTNLAFMPMALAETSPDPRSPGNSDNQIDSPKDGEASDIENGSDTFEDTGNPSKRPSGNNPADPNPPCQSNCGGGGGGRRRHREEVTPPVVMPTELSPELRSQLLNLLSLILALRNAQFPFVSGYLTPVIPEIKG